METNRVFFPQEALDAWLEDERITLDGDIMILNQEQQRFKLSTAFRFLKEVADGGDANNLVGKVKTKEQIEALEGEHCSDSVIIGDDAYEIVEGFVGELLPETEQVLVGHDMSAATRAAAGEQVSRDSNDPLTRFFMKNR